MGSADCRTNPIADRLQIHATDTPHVDNIFVPSKKGAKLELRRPKTPLKNDLTLPPLRVLRRAKRVRSGFLSLRSGKRRICMIAETSSANWPRQSSRLGKPQVNTATPFNTSHLPPCVLKLRNAHNCLTILRFGFPEVSSSYMPPIKFVLKIMRQSGRVVPGAVLFT